MFKLGVHLAINWIWEFLRVTSHVFLVRQPKSRDNLNLITWMTTSREVSWRGHAKIFPWAALIINGSEPLNGSNGDLKMTPGKFIQVPGNNLANHTPPVLIVPGLLSFGE